MATPIHHQQPQAAPGGEFSLPGPVRIRNITPNDAEFAGRMAVEAFRGKFEWAAGKRNVEGCMKAQAAMYGSMDAEQMSRVFIADYEGQQAGMVALKFHGNKEFSGSDDVTFQEVGCCGSMGLMCMSCVVSGGDISVGSCYVDHICVDSQFRGKGIGKALMDKAEHEARMRQCRTMILYVARDNRATNLYQRQGYRIVENEDGWLFTWMAVGIRKWYKMEKNL